MSVDPDITRAILREELANMEPLATSYGWIVCPDLAAMTVTVRMMSAIDSEVYLLEACCEDYKALPPIFEFVHPSNLAERGTARCYPQDGSFFHPNPCICVEWNRKAYQPLGGPHGDWQMTNWITARPGMTVLGDMLHLVQQQINNREQYRGRMG